MEIINKILQKDIFFSLALIAAALLVSVVTYFFVLFLVRRLQNVVFFGKFKIPSFCLKAPLRSLIPAVCVLSVMPMLRLRADIGAWLSNVFSLWFIASAGWFLIRVVHAGRESFLSLYDINTADNLKARRIYTQVKVIENIIIFVIVFLTVTFILLSFERVRQVGTGLLASAGVIGIVFGFAAQKTLGNFIAGIQIAFAQPIRIDDVVIVENEWGRIEEITLTYVVVRIWDLRRLILPISYFLEKPFQNWTRVSADILGSVFIYADYTVPVGKIRQELTRILENNPLWDKKVNSLQVTDTKESTVELRALMSAQDSPSAWDLRCQVREKLLTFLQRELPHSLPKTRVTLNREQ
jgi:small-conductance mechanosensitive channel